MAALFTNTLENHPAVENRKSLPNLDRYVQIIELIVLKIANVTAGNTVQVMVAFHIRIKSFGAAVNFYQIHNADFSKCQQRAAHGVVGNIGKFFFDDLKHGIYGRMRSGIK